MTIFMEFIHTPSDIMRGSDTNRWSMSMPALDMKKRLQQIEINLTWLKYMNLFIDFIHVR